MKMKDIKWGDRTRKDLGDLQELADDIKRLGLIHPIVLDETNTLRVGARRLSALIINEVFDLEEGIHFRYMKDLSELEKQEIELSENVKRKDFLFQEEVDLKQKLHELRQKMAEKKGEEWKIEDTAKEWGCSEWTVRKDIELSDFMKKHPELKKETEKTTAASKMKRMKEEMKRSTTVGLIK